VCTQHFISFRKFFNADYKSGFVVCADSFDNVSGKFPIAFTIWDLNGSRFPEYIEVDVPETGGKKKFWDDFINGLVQEPGWFSANQRLASSLSKNHDF
jgi:hypothetical protein